MRPISEQLAPLVGRWATTISMLHPSEEKGKSYRAVDTYRWLPGEKVLLHEVQAWMGEAVTSLEVYTQDADGAIVSRNFDQHGQVADYRAAMEGGVWAIMGQTERFSSTLLSADRIEGLWQTRTDAGWVDWMSVRLERVA